MNQKLRLIATIRSLARLLVGKPKIPPSLADNSLLQVILNRRSVRSFTSQVIPEDVFTAILEAGRLAPSTVNLQTWAFAVFDAGLWKKIFDRPIPFHGSRGVIVIADTYRARQVLDVFPYSPLVEHTVAVMNASLAAMNMNIAAEALGVSSVMLSETGRSGLLDAKYLKERLCLPEGTVPLMTIVFGYARGPYPPMPPKLPLNQIYFTGEYKEADLHILEDWMAQMTADHKATFPLSSLNAHLNVYKSKIVIAEKDLNRMVFHKQIHD